MEGLTLVVGVDTVSSTLAVLGSSPGDGCPWGKERPGGTFGVADRVELSRGN